MRLTDSNNNPLPSTIDLKNSDEGFIIEAVSDAGSPVSSSWVLTFDRGFEYSERIGSLSSTPHTFTATGTQVTYTPPTNAPQSWQGIQHAIITCTPSNGEPARSIRITIS
jgi:hypothetical protein